MKLPHLSVSRPVFVTMAFLGILMIAVFSYTKLPVDQLPEIEVPTVSVIITWPGASTEDVERKLTEVAENQLAIVSGLDKIQSTSKEGLSVIRLKFNWGTNLDEASNDIRDRLDFAAAFLPDDINKPIIFKFDTSMMPILAYGITAETNWNNLWDIADDNIAKELQQVSGVGSVQIFGGRERQVNLRLDPEALIARNISLSEIDAKIAAANITRPAGSAKVGRTKYIIRIPAEFERPEEIENLIIKTSGNANVYMRDIIMDKRVTLGFVEQTQVVTVDGKNAMYMIVQKRSGSNTIEVTKNVQARMDLLRKRLPKDIQIVEFYNSSTFIQQSINNLTETAMYGVIFVCLITLLFLRNFRNTMVILVTMPFSLMVAFIFLYLLGYTINIISLASIAVGVGMVVDDAIVVLENIVRRVEKGERVREASIFGTSEVGTAVTASTFTTAIVFVPLLFLGGFVGIMFRQLAVTIIVTIVASLFCALTLSPMLASRLVRPFEKMLPGNPLLRRMYGASENVFKRIESGYSSILGWALRHKPVVFLIAGLAISVIIALVSTVGTELMPAQDAGDVAIYYRMKVGTKVEDTRAAGEAIAQALKDVAGDSALHVSLRCGESSSGMTAAFGEEGSHLGQVGGKLVPVSQRKMRTDEIGQKVIEKIKNSEWGPYIEKIYVDAGNPMDRIMSSGSQPISVEVLGYDLEKTNALANQLKSVIENIPGGKNPTVSQELGKPELRIIIDKVKAQDIGVDAASVANDIDTFYRGNIASTFRKGSREYDIQLRLAPQYREDTENVLDTTITLPGGRQIVAAAVADLERKAGPVTIERKNRQRVIRVDAAAFQRSIGDVVGDINKQVEEMRNKGEIPDGVAIEQGGSYEEQQKSMNDMMLLLGMGLVLVFMVMAAQFESMKQSLIIMFSVPFAFVGVIIVLSLTHMTLNMMSMIGVVLLVGIVVKNAIILLDFTNILRARGLNMVDAIKTAGRTRLRPVLMTATSTILGMLPLAVLPGEGSETWQPMAVAVIGGLTLSTLVTLVFVPTLYSVWVRERKGIAASQLAAAPEPPQNE